MFRSYTRTMLSKKFSRAFALVLPILILGVSVGCAQKSEHRSPLANAYKLLDEGRNAEAVDELEALHDKYPDDKKITVTLASAYASLAHLQVYAFYDLFYDAMFSRPWVELSKGGRGNGLDIKPISIPSADDLKTKTSSELMNIVLKNFVNALSALSQISSILSKIPSVTAETKPYLEQALILLDSIDKPERGHALFRALLRGTYLKYLIAEELNSNATSDIVKYDATGHCSFHADMLSIGIQEVGKIAGQLVNDLTIAFPKDKATFSGARDAIKNSFAAISLTFDSVSALQEQKDIESALNQVWGCGR